MPRQPELFAGTLPRQPELFAGTLPRQPELFAGTLPRQPELFAGTLPRQPELFAPQLTRRRNVLPWPRISPRRQHPMAQRPRIRGSLVDQIENLEIGQSVATVERHDLGTGLYDPADANTRLQRMRSNMSSYLTRAADSDPDRDFKMESGAYLNDDRSAIITVVTVTREN